MISKKRILFIYLSIILIAIISVVYIASVGSSYDLQSRILLSEDTGYSVGAEFSQEGVVELGDTHMEDGEIVFSLRSLSKGRTDAVFTVNTDEGASPVYRTSFYVTTLGTIFERSETTFNFSGYKVVIFQILFALAIVLAFLILSFIGMQRKAMFTYTMVAYGGGALFLTILIAFLIYKMMNNMVTSFSIFLSLFADTGMQFLIAMTPLMLALAVAVSVSNIWLLRHEGYRPVNALGIAFSILWVVGTAISFNLIITDIVHIEEYRIADSLNKAFIYLFCHFECMLLSTAVCAYSATRHTPPHDRDCIIILGCAIRPDGSPTPLLRMRIDSALAFEKAQYEENGRHAVFIPSGGQGSDEIISEGESMRRYLCEQGVPDDRIAVEGRSGSTYENMKFSKEVIDRCCGDNTQPKIAFATTNYHVFRGYILARKNGFEAQGISAKTKWYFYPNAFLREFIGLLAEKKWYHLAFLVVMLAIFIGINLVK